MPTQSTIDLRSDTVTQPTPDMRAAIAQALVGDDVLGDDPTIKALEARCADLFAKQAACLVPSGTMANLTALCASTRPGDEVIAHKESHLYHYETAGYAAVAGCSLKLIDGPGGMFDASAIAPAVRPPDHHFPQTSLVWIENTTNRGRGLAWPLDRLRAVYEESHRLGLAVHMDGARIWNAAAALNTPIADIARNADTISACFSKGLGCPVGSIVVGTTETIHRVRHIRKRLGGTVRQGGILAAAALYALDHHLPRIADDHATARAFADRIADIPGVSIDANALQTNLVYFDTDPAWGTAEQLCADIENNCGVRLLHEGPNTIRAVTHLHIDHDTALEAANRIHKFLIK